MVVVKARGSPFFSFLTNSVPDCPRRHPRYNYCYDIRSTSHSDIRSWGREITIPAEAEWRQVSPASFWPCFLLSSIYLVRGMAKTRRWRTIGRLWRIGCLFQLTLKLLQEPHAHCSLKLQSRGRYERAVSAWLSGKFPSVNH